MSHLVCVLLIFLHGASVPVTIHTLSEVGSSRGTAYAASNKMVTLGGKTHVAWLDSVSGTRVCTYDHATGTLGPAVAVGEGHDNHGGPSMCADSEGYLHIVFGPHHHPFQYRRSVRPKDVSEWTPVSTFAERATYPSLVCDGEDTLHVVYRRSGEVWRLVYQRKPKGLGWSEAVELLEVPCKGYTQWGNALSVDGKDRLHLGFHLYASARNNSGFAFGYFYSDDHGTTWRTTDGEVVQAPATAESCRPIRTSAEMDIRVGNLDVAADGTVYMTVVGRKGQPGRTGELWKLNGGVWRAIDLKGFLQPPWDKITGAVVSVVEDGTLYVALSSGDEAWGGAGREIHLLVSRDGGMTFDAQPVSVQDPALANWLPNIERNMGHAPVRVPHLLFTHGAPGKKNSDEAATEIQFAVIGD